MSPCGTAPPPVPFHAAAHVERLPGLDEHAFFVHLSQVAGAAIDEGN
jgi:hypothetical protein